MKTLLVLVLLSMVSTANAGGEIYCKSTSDSGSIGFTEVNDGYKGFKGTIENTSYQFHASNHFKDESSFYGSGKLYYNYYGDLSESGTYSLRIDDITTGVGTITVYLKGASVTSRITAELECKRSPAI